MENVSSKKLFNTRELVITAFMAVILAVCSWIEIPTAVPFTLQTFAVYLSLLLLGGRNGLLSITVFELLGLVGIPVFAGFTGGVGVFLGTTGGYLVGFFFIALIYWLAEKIPVQNKLAESIIKIAALLVGTAVCYAFGTFWFMKVYTAKTAAVDFATAISWCVTPFVLFDMLKLAAAFLISGRIKKYAKL